MCTFHPRARTRATSSYITCTYMHVIYLYTCIPPTHDRGHYVMHTPASFQPFYNFSIDSVQVNNFLFGMLFSVDYLIGLYIFTSTNAVAYGHIYMPICHCVCTSES